LQAAAIDADQNIGVGLDQHARDRCARRIGDDQ
jgi:hypothetical protein